jgi:hypothetical protein
MLMNPRVGSIAVPKVKTKQIDKKMLGQAFTIKEIGPPANEHGQFDLELSHWMFGTIYANLHEVEGPP